VQNSFGDLPLLRIQSKWGPTASETRRDERRFLLYCEFKQLLERATLDKTLSLKSDVDGGDAAITRVQSGGAKESQKIFARHHAVNLAN
jgi:hypothetical protein